LTNSPFGDIHISKNKLDNVSVLFLFVSLKMTSHLKAGYAISDWLPKAS